jgi:hypothetical protein
MNPKGQKGASFKMTSQLGMAKATNSYRTAPPKPIKGGSGKMYPFGKAPRMLWNKKSKNTNGQTDLVKRYGKISKSQWAKIASKAMFGK